MIKIVKPDCFEVKNQNGLETLDFSLDEVKLHRDDDYGTIEGYASTFNSVDNGMDSVLPGAFTKSLTDRPAHKVKFLYNHDPKVVIGRTLELYEDEIGLKFKGQFSLGTSAGHDSYVLANDGALTDFSIGYRTIRSKKKDGVRQLIEVELWEVSLVAFPMNETAKVTSVKSDGPPTKRTLEQIIMRDAGQTAQFAKALLAEGTKGIVDALTAAGLSQDEAEAIMDGGYSAFSAVRDAEAKKNQIDWANMSDELGSIITSLKN